MTILFPILGQGPVVIKPFPTFLRITDKTRPVLFARATLFPAAKWKVVIYSIIKFLFILLQKKNKITRRK